MKKTVLLIVAVACLVVMAPCLGELLGLVKTLSGQQQELVETPLKYFCYDEEDENPMYNLPIYRRSSEEAYIIGLPKDTAARISAIVDAFLAETQFIYKIETEMFAEYGPIDLVPTVYDDCVGCGGGPSFEYELAEYLCSLLKPQQLVTMAVEHPEAVIRGYMSNIILNKYPHEAVEIAIRGIADTTEIYFKSGCCGGDRDRLNEFRVRPLIFLEKFFHDSIPDYERLEKTVLYSDQVKQFDAWGRLYENMEPKPEYYPRLKSLFDPKQYIAPIIAIVKYHREEDKQLLLRLLKDSNDDSILYMAVSAWPDAAFATALRNRVQSSIQNKEYVSEEQFIALMQYEEPWAFSLIESSIFNRESSERGDDDFYFEQAYRPIQPTTSNPSTTRLSKRNNQDFDSLHRAMKPPEWAKRGIDSAIVIENEEPIPQKS